MSKVIILGAGPSSLAAGYILSQNGCSSIIIEKNSMVGGNSRTICHGRFRFDIGGHRFYSKDNNINNFLKELMNNELLVVKKKCRIYFNNKFIDYPFKLLNLIFSLKISQLIKIIFDYLEIKLHKNDSLSVDSLKRWIQTHFGMTLYQLYFKPYSEKVWGISCEDISFHWAEERIEKISLKNIIENFFPIFRSNAFGNIFYYPKLGFGRIAEKMAEGIRKKSLLLNSKAIRLNHDNERIFSLVINKDGIEREIDCHSSGVISSIPITELVSILNPPADIKVLTAAKLLSYRDLIIIFLIIDKEYVTKSTWIYFPQRDISFGRIHEPKNWSKYMVEEGKTSLAIEYFCSEGDALWKQSDVKIKDLAIKDLSKVGFISKDQILDYEVIREKYAYPVYRLGYEKNLSLIKNYLARFRNLQSIGRAGAFKYTSLDYYLNMGINAAENILNK